MPIFKHDMIQIAGQYAKNPVTLATTEHLQYFLVTEDVDGETIPPSALLPRPDRPLAMSLVIPPRLS